MFIQSRYLPHIDNTERIGFFSIEQILDFKVKPGIKPQTIGIILQYQMVHSISNFIRLE